MLARPHPGERSWTPVGAVTFVGVGATGLEPMTLSLRPTSHSAKKSRVRCAGLFSFLASLVEPRGSGPKVRSGSNE